MWVRCASTVRGETKSSSAICRLVRPCATRSATWRSAAVRASSTDGVRGAGPVEDRRDQRDGVGGQVVAVDPLRRRPARRHHVVVGGVAPAHRHARRAQREGGRGQEPRLGEVARPRDPGEAVEHVGGAQRQPHGAAVVEGGEVGRRGLVEVAEADERPAEQQPCLDAVAAQPGGVGERHHVGGEPGCLLGLARRRAGRARPGRAPGSRTAHGSVSRTTSVARHVGSMPRSSVSASSPTRSSASSRASTHHGAGAGHRLGDAALLERDAGQHGAGGQVDPALVAGGPRGHRVDGGLGRLGEAALGGVDVGEGAGGLAADRARRGRGSIARLASASARVRSPASRCISARMEAVLASCSSGRGAAEACSSARSSSQRPS